jgi:hypothetical protein
VFRAGVWYIRNSNTGPVVKSFTFGRSGDIPVCGNWPTPGKSPGPDHPGVYRAGVWYLRYSLSTGPSNYSLRWGDSLSRPVVGDWNGDGWDQPGLFRAGRWQLLDTFWSLVDLSKVKTFWYGRSGDVPVVGDWNRDGLTTVGVKRGPKWYVSNVLALRRPRPSTTASLPTGPSSGADRAVRGTGGPRPVPHASGAQMRSRSSACSQSRDPSRSRRRPCARSRPIGTALTVPRP